MATVAYLTDNHTAAPEENPRAFGAITDGWVVKNNSVLISDVTSTIADGPHNAFNHASTSGYDVTIDTGEAMVSGSPIGKDVTTTVTLASSTTGQTVYVGSEPQTQDSVVVGLDADFTSSAIRIPIWEFDTDSLTVTSSTDLRDIGAYVNVPNRRYETSDGTGTTVDNASQLDGIDSSNFARTDQSSTFTATVSIKAPNNHIHLNDSDNNDREWKIESHSDDVYFYDSKNTRRGFTVGGNGNASVDNGELETATGFATTSSSHYEIQKNGTDGTGIINFKT